MNDGMFIALRAEAQEMNSLLKQVLGEQKRTNDLLAQLAAPLTPSSFEDEMAKIMAEERASIKATPKKDEPAHTPGRIYTEVQTASKATPKKGK